MANPLPKISAFISYSTKEKKYGAAVKQVLEEFQIECFLAHEDLEVSEEWKERILEELLRCEVFIPLLSKAFRESDWAPQEVGVVAGRGDVAIVPLSIDGTMPFGFLSHLQGKRFPAQEALGDLLIGSMAKKHPHKLIPGMIHRVAEAGGFRHAEAMMKPLVPLFPLLNDDELDALVTASIENNQVWSAGGCRVDYLPQLIQLHRKRIKPKKLKALEYQVENDRRYNDAEV